MAGDWDVELALLRDLRGGYGPIWAARKIAFAATYTTTFSTLSEATVVRISRSTSVGICELRTPNLRIREVSTISIGTYRSCEGKPAVERPISSPKAGSCQYWQRC